MFIIYGLFYLSVRCPTDEEMGYLPKVLLTPSGEQNPSYLDDDVQWEDSENEVSIGPNVSATSFAQYNDVLKSILSSTHYKAPNITFADDVDFTKGATDEKLFYDISKLDTHEFDEYKVFSTSPSVSPFDTNYVYSYTRKLIYIVSSITAILLSVCAVVTLVRY